MKFLTFLVYLTSLFILGSTAYYKDFINVGTVLFRDTDTSKECWSRVEYELLNSRRIMNNLIPKDMPNDEPDEYVPALIEYFKICVGNIQKNSKGTARHILLMALADVFGGFLHVYTLPFIKHQYYAGLVEYGHVQNLYELYGDLTRFLKTNGAGWKKSRSLLAECLSMS